MMEFYQAYATYEDLMVMTEEMITSVALELFDSLRIEYQGTEIDLSRPWQRLTVKEAILKYSKATPICWKIGQRPLSSQGSGTSPLMMNRWER